MLCEVAEGTRELLGVETIETVADKGYRKPEDLQECLEKGIIPNVYLPDDKYNYTFELDYEAAVITEEIRKSVQPEDIKKCLSAGIIPNIYDNINLTLEVAEKTERKRMEEDGQNVAELPDNIDTLLQAGYFVRDKEKDTVTCPMGFILRKKCTNRGNDRYYNKIACSECKNKCTKSKYQTVDFKPRQNKVKSKVWAGKVSSETDNPPQIGITPKLKQISKKKTVVIMRFVPDGKKLRQRKCLSEHPFGTVKRWHDGSYLLLKGKEKVTSELSLSFLVYNLKRANNELGIQKIMSMI